MARGRWVPVPQAEEPKASTPSLEEIERELKKELAELDTLKAETKKEKAAAEFREKRMEGKRDSGMYKELLLKDVKKLKAQLRDAKIDLELEETTGFRVVVPKGWRRPLRERDVVVVLTHDELRILERALTSWRGSGQVDADLVEAGGADISLVDYLALCREACSRDKWPEQYAHVGQAGHIDRQAEEIVARFLVDEAVAREKRKASLDSIESGAVDARRRMTRKDAEAWAKAAGADVAYVIANHPVFAHLRETSDAASPSA